MARDDYSTAEKMYREAADALSEVQAPDHVNTGIARIKPGRSLLRQRRYAEAEQETLAGYTIVSKKAAPTSSWLTSAREDLVEISEARHQSRKADLMRAEAAHHTQNLSGRSSAIK